MKKIYFLILLVQHSILAQWSADPSQPNAIVVGSNNQDPFTVTGQHSVMDNTGNIITIFSDPTNNSYVNAQKIDANGNKLWGDRGMVIYNGSYLYNATQQYTGNRQAQIVSDGAGGAIISFIGTDYNFTYNLSSPGFLFAIKIDSNGNQVWANKTYVNQSNAINGNANNFRLISDDNGGAYFAWTSNVYNGLSNPTTTKTFFQHLNADGSLQYANEILIKDMVLSFGSNGALDHFPSLTKLSTGEILVTWVDKPGGVLTLFANKLDSSGNLLWGSDGIILDTNLYADNPEVSRKNSPKFGVVNNGVYLLYKTNAFNRICFLRNDGTTAFNLPLSASFGFVNSYYYDLALTNSGNAMVLYDDNNGHAYIQKIDEAGNKLFDPGGILLGTDDCSVSYSAIEKGMIKTSNGDFLVTYYGSHSGGGNYKVKAEMFDENGTFLFPTGGIALCYYRKDYFNLLKTNDGGAVLVCSGYANETSPTQRDVYAFKINATNNPVQVLLLNGTSASVMATHDNINYRLENYVLATNDGLRFTKDNNAVSYRTTTSPTGTAVCGTAVNTVVPAGTYNVSFNLLSKEYSFENTLSTFQTKHSTVSIAPNPVKTVLNISKQCEFIDIYTLDGRKVWHTDKTRTVDVTSLSKGIYIMKGITDDNETLLSKFLKVDQ